MIYFSFKEWFVFLEVKKPYDIALEIVKQNGGDENILKKFSDLLPVDLRDRNKILALTVFYGLNHDVNPSRNVSKVDDTVFMNQLRTDMMDYLSLVRQNAMPNLVVDDNHNVQVQGTVPETLTNYNSYLKWTEIVHGKTAERTRKEKLSNIETDLSDMKVIAKNPEGTIKVYDAHGVEKCIALGKGQRFCISQPANTMWQSYRDTKQSTYHFVYDSTRNDRLKIVVVDATKHGIELTDVPNTTGRIGDPQNPEKTLVGNEGVKAYFDYLRKQGVIGSNGETDIRKIFINIPQSDEEIKEQELLGRSFESLQQFVSLGYDLMSKYIGRGHELTDEQFDYIYEYFPTLLKQYISVGIKINDYQLKKLIQSKSKYKDYIENYLHNRLIADENSDDFDNKEYELLKSKNLIEREKKILDEKGLNFWIRCDIKKAENIIQSESENKIYDFTYHTDLRKSFANLIAISPISFIEKYSNKFCFNSFSEEGRLCGFDFLKIAVSDKKQLSHGGSSVNELVKDIADNILSEAFHEMINSLKHDNFNYVMSFFTGEFFPKENCLKKYFGPNNKIVKIAPHLTLDSLETYFWMKSKIYAEDIEATLCKNNDDFTNSVFNKYNKSNPDYSYYSPMQILLYSSDNFINFITRALKNAKSKAANYDKDALLMFLSKALDKQEYHNMLKEFDNLHDEEQVESWINEKIVNAIIGKESHIYVTIDDETAFKIFKTYIDADEKTREKYSLTPDYFIRMKGNKINFIDKVLKLENCNDFCLYVLKEMAKQYVYFISSAKNVPYTEEEIESVLEKFKSIKYKSINILEKAIDEYNNYSVINNSSMTIIFKVLGDSPYVEDYFAQVLKGLLVTTSEDLIKQFESSFSPERLEELYKEKFNYSFETGLSSFFTSIFTLNSVKTSAFVNNLIKHFSKYVNVDLFAATMNDFFDNLNPSLRLTDSGDNKTQDLMLREYVDNWRRFKNFFVSKGQEYKNAYEKVINDKENKKEIEKNRFDISRF